MDPDNNSIELDDRMKIYEKNYETNIPFPYLPYIVRLDGSCFSKFTRDLRKPFDDLFQISMISTMNDLVEHFSARTGYTHSDEITLIFSNVCSKEEYMEDNDKFTHMYNGRIQKITSLTASYCSTRFSHHIKKILEHSSLYKPQMLQKIYNPHIYFDARILYFPENKLGEILNHMIWRSVRDCHKNAVSTYGRQYFSDKQLHKKNSDDIIKMLESININWNDVPIWYKHGVYAKRELYLKEVEYNGEKKEVIRHMITNKCFVIKYSDEMYEILLNKKWPEDLENINTFYNISIIDDNISISK
jgi:tRNA(His) guanylyltransferase